MSVCLYVCTHVWKTTHVQTSQHFSGMKGAGLVPWVGGLPDASFGYYLREAFQSQTNTEKIIQLESLGTDML